MIKYMMIPILLTVAACQTVPVDFHKKPTYHDQVVEDLLNTIENNRNWDKKNIRCDAEGNCNYV